MKYAVYASGVVVFNHKTHEKAIFNDKKQAFSYADELNESGCGLFIVREYHEKGEICKKED